MVLRKIIVQLPRGLQARHTALFVQKVHSFKSDIIIVKNGKPAHGRSIMKVMDLFIQEEELITLIITGPDEQNAAEILENFLLNKL